MPEYELVIGLETHIQLNTTTKIFCSCKADSWNEPPNTNICPVCSGLPGVLPVLNRAAVEKGVILAQAMHSEIPALSFFDRKNYFYPDLPKGFQISQFDRPLGKGGYLDVPMPQGYTRRVTIHNLHLEEDAGKTHNEHGQRLVDFNRCGVPLIEMVTNPDLRSADEAAQYLIRLRQLLRQWGRRRLLWQRWRHRLLRPRPRLQRLRLLLLELGQRQQHGGVLLLERRLLQLGQ